MITLFKKVTPAALTVAIATGMMAGAATLYAPPAHAIYCSNCSTVWNQMMEYAKAVETSINTARQLQTQIQQYNDMIKQGLESPRVLRRLHFLRGCSHEQDQQVFP